MMYPKEKLEDGFGLLGLIFVIAIVGIFTGGGLYFKELQHQKSLLDIGRDAEKQAQELKKKINEEQKKIDEELNNQGRVCTQEAKQCPDGSYVSRTGPNCEFAACLGAKGGLQNQAKFCRKDNDCILSICSGAFNKEWAKTVPPDLPCRVYEGYTARCVEQKCTEIESIDTSIWKTYRSEKYGFEVKYPESWEKFENPPLYGSSINRIELAETKKVPWPGNFLIQVFENKDKLILESWIEKNYQPKTPTGSSLVKQQNNSVLNNITAKTLKVFSFDSWELVVIAAKGEYVYFLQFDAENPNDPDFLEHKKITNQILSTFKFIPPTSSGLVK